MSSHLSIVRDNLLNRPGYTPYCGAPHCHFRWPRTHFNGEQFKCGCGWQSSFEAPFIEQYKRGATHTSGERTDG
jgi:hypothetical protein